MDYNLTPAEAEARLTKIRADLTGPYFNRHDQRHREAIVEVERLTRIVVREATPRRSSSARGQGKPTRPQASDEDVYIII